MWKLLSITSIIRNRLNVSMIFRKHDKAGRAAIIQTDKYKGIT